MFRCKPFVFLAAFPLFAFGQGITLNVAADNVSSTKIYPVWARQDIWQPWNFWNPSYPSHWTPLFNKLMPERHIVMATGQRPFDATYTVADLYTNSTINPAFPNLNINHPIFSALQIFRSQGIFPVIDIGPCPSQFTSNATLSKDLNSTDPNYSFDWNLGAPTEYQKWHDLIKEFFHYLHDPSGMNIGWAELNSWHYHLLREPNNKYAWDPTNAQKFDDQNNLTKYMEFYDWTLSGMLDAGLSRNLDIGNLQSDATSWTIPLVQFLFDGAKAPPPGCPLMQIPRVNSNDTVTFSHSRYGGDPRMFRNADSRWINMIKAYIPSNRASQPLLFTIGESNIPALNRSDASEVGAAWNAAVFKNAMDAGLQRVQQWDFISASNISHFDDENGVESPTYRVIEMLNKMVGQKRIPLTPSGNPSTSTDYVDGIASEIDPHLVYVLVFNQNMMLGGTENVTLSISGLLKSKNYSITQYRIDHNHSNYFTQMTNDMAGKGPISQDALMANGAGLSATQYPIFTANMASYQSLSSLSQIEGPYLQSSDGIGVISKTVSLPSNSVALIKLEVPTLVPTVLMLNL
jgi:hypothetical protein